MIYEFGSATASTIQGVYETFEKRATNRLLSDPHNTLVFIGKVLQW